MQTKNAVSSATSISIRYVKVIIQFTGVEARTYGCVRILRPVPPVRTYTYAYVPALNFGAAVWRIDFMNIIMVWRRCINTQQSHSAAVFRV